MAMKTGSEYLASPARRPGSLDARPTHQGRHRSTRACARRPYLGVVHRISSRKRPTANCSLTRRTASAIPSPFSCPAPPKTCAAEGAAFYEWARWSNGMFGRTPDYKNASVMAFAGAADFLNEGGTEAANAVDFAGQHAQLLPTRPPQGSCPHPHFGQPAIQC